MRLLRLCFGGRKAAPLTSKETEKRGLTLRPLSSLHPERQTSTAFLLLMKRMHATIQTGRGRRNEMCLVYLFHSSYSSYIFSSMMQRDQAEAFLDPESALVSTDVLTYQAATK